jgi:PPM family protein phosphatase
LATAVVRYAAAAQTDRGRKRPSNEDAFGFSVDHGIYVVADGMGGAAAGEIASSLAVDEVLRHLTSGRDAAVPLPGLAEKAVCAANEAIYSRAQRNRRLNGMGTTLVALVVEESRVWVLNVGDSRCYRFRNGRLEQLTLDHSLVEEQVRMGRMSNAEARRSPLRNVITRALGTQNCVTPDCFEFQVEPGDVYMLCSDGLTRELTDKAIETILDSKSDSKPQSKPNPKLDSIPDSDTLPDSGSSRLQARCARLVEAAKKAGGHDNITCILVQANG